MTNGGNGPVSGDELRGYLETVAAADDELLTLKSAHMQSCKAPRKKIRETIGEAKRNGINVTALRELIARDRSKRRHDRRIAQLEADDAEDYASMEAALGGLADTPLGQAALARAKGEEALDNLSA
jgi:hypothetical protein